MEVREFIVWDKENKEFTEDVTVSCDGEIAFGKYPEGGRIVDVWDNLTIHQYIGKTDINNKKIYADCSIVEFNGTEGFIKWCDTMMYYVLTPLNPPYITLQVNPILCSKFKIIDTIQENKLGLIKQ